jgi:CelD/BcsL family acetyltransferase involved in cellulose biosynthesis
MNSINSATRHSRRRLTDLSGELLSRWLELLSETETGTPFLHPEYCRVLGSVNPDVELLLIENSNDVAFFPVQRVGRIAYPAGLRLADYSGIIAPPTMDIDVSGLLKAADLHGLNFSNCIGQACQFGEVLQRDESPYIELGEGVDAWLQTLKNNGSSTLKQAQRKARKVAREVGPLRFEWRTSDAALLDTLLDWKSAQRQRTGKYNILQLEWARNLVTLLPSIETSSFSGLLSCLYAGDELLAVHLGMHTPNTLHWWIPSYNPAYSAYSPGAIFLLELARAAAEHGISRIDLGKGDERYKSSFRSGSTEVASVYRDNRFARQWIARKKQALKEGIRGTALESHLKNLRKSGLKAGQRRS